MTGKILAIVLGVLTLVAGASMYYLQVYAFYDDVEPAALDLTLVPEGGGAAVAIPAGGIEAIDADSSPIRFRACFDTTLSPGEAAERFVPYEDAVPLNAPFWFRCFDAEAIGAALDAGTARAFLSEKNIGYGVDRIVAVTDTGRGYAWHQLNDCGDLAYDGTPTGEACPPRDAFPEDP